MKSWTPERINEEKVRLYCFFNMEQSKHGEPFALCDKHYKEQLKPEFCILQKIADNPVDECEECYHSKESKQNEQM